MNSLIPRSQGDLVRSLGQFLPMLSSPSPSDIKIGIVVAVIFAAMALAVRMFLCSGRHTAAKQPVSPLKEERLRAEPTDLKSSPASVFHSSPKVEQEEVIKKEEVVRAEEDIKQEKDQQASEESSQASQEENKIQPKVPVTPPSLNLELIDSKNVESEHAYLKEVQQQKKLPVIPSMPDFDFNALFIELGRPTGTIDYMPYHKDIANCRFGDILCPRETRWNETDQLSDGTEIKLHANKVDLEGLSFIATQYPMPYHIPLFWRMGAKSCLILDLTNEKDMKKGLEPYYPSRGEEIFQGKLSITCKEQEIFTDLDATLSSYLVEEDDEDDSAEETSVEGKQCCRLHFQGWDDFGGITESQMDRILEMMETSQTDPSVPLIVHCRAGVGRTGTILVARALLKLIKEHKVNESNLLDEISRLISEGRMQRGKGFVQTPIQLRAIFKWAWKALHRHQG